jgi:hypothetical protein
MHRAIDIMNKHVGENTEWLGKEKCSFLKGQLCKTILESGILILLAIFAFHSLLTQQKIAGKTLALIIFRFQSFCSHLKLDRKASF